MEPFRNAIPGDEPPDSPSASSSSDFYLAAADTALTEETLQLQLAELLAPAVAQKNGQTHGQTNGHHMVDRSNGEVELDGSSEMSLSNGSRSPSPAPSQLGTETGAKCEVRHDAPTADSLAPKSSGPLEEAGPSAQPTAVENSGPGDQSLDPTSWQRIFLFLPPAALARCLRVCRKFHLYLTGTKLEICQASNIALMGPAAEVPVLDGDAIWGHARKIHFNQLPRPLLGFTELQMLQLLGAHTCQDCQKRYVPSPANSPFKSGPGRNGVRVIWPFGVRLCGACLEQNITRVGAPQALRLSMTSR